MYILQTGKYGSGWTEESKHELLGDAIHAGKDAETFAKYHYRVIDTDNHDKIMWTKTIPYEGIYINLADESCSWLVDIAGDYGISKELMFKAILKWLAIHVTPNGI